MVTRWKKCTQQVKLVRWTTSYMIYQKCFLCCNMAVKHNALRAIIWFPTDFHVILPSNFWSWMHVSGKANNCKSRFIFLSLGILKDRNLFQINAADDWSDYEYFKELTSVLLLDQWNQESPTTVTSENCFTQLESEWKSFDSRFALGHDLHLSGNFKTLPHTLNRIVLL